MLSQLHRYFMSFEIIMASRSQSLRVLALVIVRLGGMDDCREHVHLRFGEISKLRSAPKATTSYLTKHDLYLARTATDEW